MLPVSNARMGPFSLGMEDIVLITHLILDSVIVQFDAVRDWILSEAPQVAEPRSAKQVDRTAAAERKRRPIAVLRYPLCSHRWSKSGWRGPRSLHAKALQQELAALGEFLGI